MKTYALINKDGEAMLETALDEKEFTEANKKQVIANALPDWNGEDFQDVTDDEDALATGETGALYLNLKPENVHVVYTDDVEGSTHLQPVGDLVDAGTLINEEGDDMPVTGGQATIDEAAIARFTALLEDIKTGNNTADTATQAHQLIASLGIQNPIHPESALFTAGATNGYYEIVGASYTPATDGHAATATIDLSTPDHTGCLITHHYGTQETTLKWDSEDPSEVLMGAAEDVETAIGDITGEGKETIELFDGFQAIMLKGSPHDS